MVVSIIVPVFNVARYLDDCVESLVKQTYQKLEILLIDDGSTDNSGLLCDKWAQRDSRIKVIHTLNHGVSHARNIGLQNARGDFIGFVDADDWVEHDMYEKMLKFMLETQTDICVSAYVKDTNNNIERPFRTLPSQVFLRDEIILQTFRHVSSTKEKIISWELWDKLFSKKVVKNIRLNEKITMGEDALFYWEALSKSNKIAYLPLYKYHYKIRINSIMHSQLSEKQLTGFCAMYLIYKSALKQENYKIKENVRELFIVEGIRYNRRMFTLSPCKYKKIIMSFQKFLRTHFVNALLIKNTSIRIKLGIIYLCMPYRLGTLLCGLAKKDTF